MILTMEKFVILKTPKYGVEKNSIGIVEKVINDKKLNVFFIGKKIKFDVTKDDFDFIDVTKTGKPYKNKICNICHILKKDFVDFEINQTDARGRKTTRPSCRSCRKNLGGITLKSNERKKMLESKPTGLFNCPICEKTSIPNVTAKLVIDHNHENGKARAWLCDSCNTGLGRFKEDINFLQKAIDFLEKHKQTN